MPQLKPGKGWFASHAKSSAVAASLSLHGIILLAALSFVAATVVQKEETRFEYRQVDRPRLPLKKLQVPVKISKKQSQPKLRRRLVAQNLDRKAPEINLPEISGVKGGMGSSVDGGIAGPGMGFTLPEINFFGAKAKGQKVCFIVHFGPATIGGTPYSRMTGYAIRKRLAEMVGALPGYVLFNVACYWFDDTWAMDPQMQLATPANKQKVRDWMAPVNPLEGDYKHCFFRRKDSPFDRAVVNARSNYPTRIDRGLPFHAPKWIYPYVVPKEIEQEHAPDAPHGFMHWGRGVAWAILNQKPDTIFVLTTNYVDGWNPNEPRKMAHSLTGMLRDAYGVDRKKWPSINVVVLDNVGMDSRKSAAHVLHNEFGPIWKGFRGTGTVIDDISKFMNDEEKALLRNYAAHYRN